MTVDAVQDVIFPWNTATLVSNVRRERFRPFAKTTRFATNALLEISAHTLTWSHHYDVPRAHSLMLDQSTAHLVKLKTLTHYSAVTRQR